MLRLLGQCKKNESANYRLVGALVQQSTTDKETSGHRSSFKKRRLFVLCQLTPKNGKSSKILISVVQCIQIVFSTYPLVISVTPSIFSQISTHSQDFGLPLLSRCFQLPGARQIQLDTSFFRNGEGASPLFPMCTGCECQMLQCNFTGLDPPLEL